MLPASQPLLTFFASPFFAPSQPKPHKTNELLSRIELPTSSLPRKCSTTELQQLQSCKDFERAGDEIRTRDLQFGRLSLYQLSYSRLFNVQMCKFENEKSPQLVHLNINAIK